MSRFVESSTVLEGSIVSAERLIEYADVRPEAAWTKEKSILPAVWPSEGLVEFKHFSSRYGFVSVFVALCGNATHFPTMNIRS